MGRFGRWGGSLESSSSSKREGIYDSDRDEYSDSARYPSYLSDFDDYDIEDDDDRDSRKAKEHEKLEDDSSDDDDYYKTATESFEAYRREKKHTGKSPHQAAVEFEFGKYGPEGLSNGGEIRKSFYKSEEHDDNEDNAEDDETWHPQGPVAENLVDDDIDIDPIQETQEHTESTTLEEAIKQEKLRRQREALRKQSDMVFGVLEIFSDSTDLDNDTEKLIEQWKTALKEASDNFINSITSNSANNNE